MRTKYIFSVPQEDYFSYLFDVYNNPWIRSQPYYLAMSIGLILHVTKNKRVKLSWVSL